jgi:ABC-type transport system substrate-binding protein
MWFNYGRNPAFKKLKVRQAFMYAIDRQALVKGLTRNTGKATTQMFPPGYLAYDPKHDVAKYPFDPGKARQLLAEAGYKDGLSVTVMVAPTTFDQALAQAVQAMLAQAGIRAQLITDPSFNSWAVAQKYDIDITSISGRADPLDTILSEVAPDGVMNPSHNRPPAKILSLIEKVKAMPIESPKRKVVLRQISGLVTKNALNIPLLTSSYNFVLHRCIVGFKPPIFGPPLLGSAGWKAGCK